MVEKYSKTLQQDKCVVGGELTLPLNPGVEGGELTLQQDQGVEGGELILQQDQGVEGGELTLQQDQGEVGGWERPSALWVCYGGPGLPPLGVCRISNSPLKENTYR